MNATRQSEKVAVEHRLREIVVAFGLEDGVEHGRFTCPLSGERITWDTLGRMSVDGEGVTFFSMNARLRN